MSAAELRQAAAELRQFWPTAQIDDPLLAAAVAEWLDHEAESVERGASSITFAGAPMFPASEASLKVARLINGNAS